MPTARADRRANAPFPTPAPWPRAVLLAALAWQGLAASPSAIAQAELTPAPASPAASVRYDIPAGTLDQVLNRFATHAGILLSIDGALTAGISGPGLQGHYTVPDGLKALLAGSGLEAVAGSDGAYVLRRSASAQPRSGEGHPRGTAGGPNTLPVVTVTAPAVRADGLAAPYAGGQVARGGRLGMLGNVDVMDTPFNVTSYTALLIQDQQAGDIGAVLDNEPSVRRSSQPGGTQQYFKTRGFDISTSDVMINGLAGLTPVYTTLPTEFMERVEVLKGANALLWGMSPNGAVAGSINVIPKRAGDEPLTRLSLGIDSGPGWRTHADVGRRFGADGQWGLRVNGSRGGGDGYVDDQAVRNGMGAVALDYRGERLRAALDVFQISDRKRGGSSIGAMVGNYSGGPSWLSRVPDAPDGNTNILPGSPGYRGSTRAAIVGLEYDFSDAWTGYARFGVQRYEMRGLFSSTVDDLQANGDAMVSPWMVGYDNRTRTGETGLRGRFRTGPVSHAVAINAAYLHQRVGNAFGFTGDTPTNLYAPAPILFWPDPITNVPKTSEKTLSGFALADTLGFADDRLLLTLGVRRQTVKTDNFNASGQVTSGYDSSAWTPMAGLVFKLRETVSLYTSYIQGLSPGTTVGDTYLNAGEVFPPYKTRQIEVGTKWQTGRFINTLSVFQLERPSTLPDASTSPLPTLRLDGEQRNRGVEWTVFGEVARGLRALGGLTFIEGRLTHTQDGLQDGHHAPGSPPWAANLGAEGDVPGLPGLALSGRVIFTGAQYIDNANSLKIPSWARFDLGGRYATRWGGRPVVFRANLDNVFDRNYWQGSYYSGNINMGAPRIFRLSVSVDL